MLGDRDPNSGGGRTSRASNMSTMSRTSGPFSHPSAKPDLLSAAGPGVMSMLRTSTEMGNVMGLTSGDLSGIGSLPRASQRRGTSSRLSTASSVSNHSSRASRHHRQWPSSSSAAHRSVTREPPIGPQYVADTLSPTLMNIPGSSPLVPRARERDSHRSLSMTHASQPVYRLSSNRSLGSLRHEQIQRPKSPYIYPTRLRRPHYRPGSPALSDVSGTTHSRRAHGYGGPGGSCYYPQQYASGYPGPYAGQQRYRTPSDASLGQQDRVPPHGPPRRPSRGPSPVYHAGPRMDMPPMPVGYQHHIAVEQARMLNRSLKGSMSSSSTNLRTDSDAPSSDMASPPTPKEEASMEVLFGPGGRRVGGEGNHGSHGAIKGPCYSRPLYFDGTEQFEREPHLEPETDSMATGFVARYTTIMEERGSPDPAPTSHAPSKTKPSLEDVRPSETTGRAELPASPVPRRITRDQILKALEPASTTGDMTSPAPSSVVKDNLASPHSEDLPAMASPVNDETMEAPLHPQDHQERRHSILSQAGSSLFDSSTLDFAVRYSIPMATGVGFKANNTSVPSNGPSTLESPEKSTEDGMSELLAGYQHTESKHSAEVTSQDMSAPEKAPAAEKLVKKKEHNRRSSDEESFKSCTDLPEVSSEPATPAQNADRRDAQSMKSAVDQRDSSMKDSDARSFSTAKVTVTPDHTASIPHSRLPSSGLATSVPLFNKTVTETPPPNPSPAVRHNQAPASLRESSLSVMASKLRASSKPNAKSSSLLVAMPGSSSMLSATQQPPAVPQRESSSSKEAQRYQAVASFLMRQLPSRRAKSWKQGNDTDDAKASSPKKQEAWSSVQDKQEIGGASASSELPSSSIKNSDRALVDPSKLPKKEEDGAVPGPNLDRIPSRISVLESMALEQQQQQQQQPAISSPSPPGQESSSSYSPQEASMRFRAHSCPADSSSSPDNVRRESQTTTHLVWPGHKSFNLHAASSSEMPTSLLPTSQENTTTDLRFSGYGYKYSGPARHLPDLKEESHEDSSLNTSASNLKNSNFRFPAGAPLGLRASVDDPVLAPPRLSTGSHRQSSIPGALGRAHGLPSMRFSQMNLFDKLNEELGLRCSQSLEDRTKASGKADNDSLQQPASASQVREKFRSLVAGLDKLERVGGSVQQPEAKGNSVVLKHCRLPEQLLAEIEGLTIPSVGGLTQRISELLPSLQEYCQLGEQGEFPEEEVIIEKAMQKLAQVAPVQKRSSARLRPMPGSPHMVVVDDAVFEEIQGSESDSSSPGRGVYRPVVEEVGSAGAGHGANLSGDSMIHRQTREDASIVELQVPSPARIRPRSHTTGPHRLRASGESDLSSRRSLRSIVTTTPTVTETRPWNSDKNFPWASTTLPSFDISLPSPAVVRNSPRPGPSHLRNRLSEACSTSSFSSGQTAAASPFGSTGTSNAHAHHHHFSVFGRSADQPHAVGERYPTSALTPPTVIFRDHLTTSETSDDEDFNPSRKSRLGLKKRFSLARSAAADQSNRLSRSKTNPQELGSPASNNPTSTLIFPPHIGEVDAPTSHRHTFRDAEGMRGVEYHRQRLVDRLKRWWHKGGSLFRTLAGRKPQDSDRY